MKIPVLALAVLPLFSLGARADIAEGDTFVLGARFSDFTGIRWCRDTSDAQAFFGKFLRFNGRTDQVGHEAPDSSSLSLHGLWIPPSWRTSGGYFGIPTVHNPFHLWNVAMPSTIPPLQEDASSIEQGRYGSQIDSYRPVRRVRAVVPLTARNPAFNWKPAGLYDALGRKMPGLRSTKAANMYVLKKTSPATPTATFELKCNK
jgi:hypothetical protein